MYMYMYIYIYIYIYIFTSPMPDPKMASTKKHTHNRDPNTDHFGAQQGDWASKAPNVDLIIRTIITLSSHKTTAAISPEIPGGQNPSFQETLC